ncbi:MAG: alkaline phosphatase D family protein, partial [Proteobacteria bacterium]|nr:alkaline phosphatase D family protein [Pseudomonadota bacterium]
QVGGGAVTASQYTDHTVKVIAQDLMPGAVYYYRFRTGNEHSTIGRTRVLPVGNVKSLGIALASCSNYQFGFFNAYDAIARDDAIDFVLHTGDYIYEYAADGWGGETARQLNRSHNPQHETVSLADYRLRHAQYKADPHSIRMHATHPMITLWDDHESTNNPWVGGAQNHQAGEGLWRDRLNASLRAYFEWMPVRNPLSTQRRQDYWRSYQFGNLATLITMESRHTGRAQQIDYADAIGHIKSMADAQRFKREVLNAPNRPMLSGAMEAFVARHLAASVESGQPWRILGNAIPMAKIPVPDVAALGVSMPDSDAAPGTRADLAWKGRYNLPFYLDTWDGYHWARERFYDLAEASGATDLLVLTGDSHSFWANQLFTDDGQAMGLEIGTAGISSPGDFVESGFEPSNAARLDRIFAENIEEVRWTDNLHQGYVCLVIEPDVVTTSYQVVSTVLTPDYTVSTLRRDTIVRAGNSLDFAS